MKIIFLDIDGVLVTDKGLRSARLAPWAPFDRAAVENLNILVRLTGAGVVISSAWRTDPSLELKWVLKRAGVQCAIVGETPVLGGRGFEIAAWLANHPGGVDQFAILDDARDSILCGRFAPNLVLTTMESGFDRKALRRALTILGGQKVSQVDPEEARGFTTLNRRIP